MKSSHNSQLQLTDTELVVAFQSKEDADAFTELYNRYYPKVEHYCLIALSDAQAAQDAAQDVFLKVFEKLPSLQQPKLWVAWLFSITRNVVLSTHKQHARTRLEDVDEFPGIADETTDLEALQEKERKLTALPKLFETPDGRILKMKYVEGRSIEQLSHEMDLKESAVKMRLLRARHQVIHLYEQRYAPGA